MFTNVAHAAGGAPAGGGAEAMLVQFMPLILMFIVFYFLLIRPQQKKAKEHKAMLDALQKGEHIITNSGMLARIVDIDGDILVIDLGKTEVKILRGYVAGIVDPKKLSGAADAVIDK